MAARLARASSLLALALAACTGSEDPSGPAPDPDEPVPPLPTGAVAAIEIYPMDLWAQPLPSDALLLVEKDGLPIETLGDTIPYVALDEAGTYQITLAANDHAPLTVQVAFDGTSEIDAAKVGGGPAGSGVAFSHEIRPGADGEEVTVHSLYLGLRNLWFSAEGRPARRGNDLRFMLDGEEAWGAVATALDNADDQIQMASWWWESDFELVRSESDPGAAARTNNTIMAKLEASPATKRILIGQFWGQDGLISDVNVDDELEARGAVGGDDFEFMGQANETEGTVYFAIPAFEFGERVRTAHTETADRAFDDEQMIESTVAERTLDLTEWPISVELQHASWHQKFAVIDELAFVGGMNMKSTDWDSSQHRVFDPRRMEFDASTADRQAVAAKEELPDLGPRKDYMVRIDGPAVQDVSDAFHRRWDLTRSEGAEYSGNASAFVVNRELASHPNGVQAQITTTMPDPLWEHGIVESWLNAVAQAQDYILIEDQYWRAPILTEAILDRMAEVPTLKLIVFTKPINEWTDPGCAWTYRTDTDLEAALGSRYTLLQLRAFDTQVTWGWDETEPRFVDMDVHSKLLIVDDTFLSVGSANKNNRGALYEGEMNIAVLDRAWVRDVRRKVIASYLGAGVAVQDDSDLWLSQLLTQAAWNDSVRAAWEVEGDDISLDGAALPAQYTPRGFVYSMDFGDVSDCLIESVGPDMT